MSRNSVISGTAILAAGNVFRYAVQLIAIPVLARMLGPEGYGIVALAAPFFFFLAQFGDFGLGTALVRERALTKEITSGIFWVSLAIALALASLLGLAARPIGWLLGQPELPGILWSFAPLFLLSSATAVPSALLQRSGRFKAVAAADILSTAIGALAAILAAYRGYGPYALVIQQWAFWLVRAAVFFGAAGFAPVFAANFAYVRNQAGFGMGLVGSRMASFIGANLDNLLVGLIAGASELGLYAVSYQFVSVPGQVLGGVHYSVMPVMAENWRRGVSPANTYAGWLRVLLMIAAPALIGFALTSDLFIGLVFNDAWKGAGSLIALLVPFGIVHVVFILNAATLIGFGRSDVEFYTTVMRAVLLTAGIAAGIVWGAKGVALGVSAASLIACAVYTYYVLKACGIPWRWVAGGIGGPLAACVPMMLTVAALRFAAFDSMPMLADLVLCVMAGAAAYVAALALFSREQFAQDIAFLRGAAARSRAA